jgi:hypothetical protein
MRDNYSNERRQAIGNINKGKSLSDQTKALIRESALNRESMSHGSRLKCIVNSRAIFVTDLDGSNSQAFNTMVEASKVLDCNVKTIRRALQSNTNILLKKYIVSDAIDS